MRRFHLSPQRRLKRLQAGIDLGTKGAVCAGGKRGNKSGVIVQVAVVGRRVMAVVTVGGSCLAQLFRFYVFLPIPGIYGV